MGQCRSQLLGRLSGSLFARATGVLATCASVFMMMGSQIVRKTSEGSGALTLAAAAKQEVPNEVTKPPAATWVEIDETYYYTVCNGFTNQLLCHAGHVAAAVKMRKRTVAILDVFIVDGTQSLPDGSVLQNTMPTDENSIPFKSVFDADKLIAEIGRFGVAAELVPYDAALHGQLGCDFLGALKAGDSKVASAVLRAMLPSPRSKLILEEVKVELRAHTRRLPSQASGVCLHHRDGADWHGHCDQWERLAPHNDNCRPSRPISQLVAERTSHLGSTWVFYAGDHEVPQQLRSDGTMVLTREQVYSFTENDVVGRFTKKKLKSSRDLRALLDFFLCSSLPYFIGNSVSTWSAAQIALRPSTASWYNSRFVPLGDFLQVYYVPVVYTFTEESSLIGKLMLQGSILTTLKHMPPSTVNVLYHGRKDSEFRSWLIQRGIVVHDHEPLWRREVERLRQAGLNGTTYNRHRFVHEGNFLGSWQRIDVPLFVSAEYCMVLDADAFVVKPLRLHEFGPQITSALAFSSGLDENVPRMVDAGVVLMNVPFMRQSLEAFHVFIFNRTPSEFELGEAHHGAYLDFYGSDVTFLGQRFSRKATYKDKASWNQVLVIHFHGLKPHDLVQYWLTSTCEPVKCFYIFQFNYHVPYQCAAIQQWTRGFVSSGPGVVEEYCEAFVPSQLALCQGFFKRLSLLTHRAGNCKNHMLSIVQEYGLSKNDFPALLAR